MDTTRGERIRLGIFLLASTLLILGVVALVVGQRIMTTHIPYYTRFTESVSGLNPGAKVKLNGISVGAVTRIEVDTSDLKAVLVHFEVNGGTPIKTTMTAGLAGGISLTGLKSIEISGGSPSDPQAPRGSYIPGSVSGIKQITGQAETIAQKVEGILNNLESLTSESNQAHITGLLNSLDSVGGWVNLFVQENDSLLRRLPVNLDTVGTNAAVVFANLGALSAALAKLPLDSAVVDARYAMQSVDLLARRADQTLYRNQEDITASVRNLREAMENLNDITRQVRENPSLLIRGEGKTQRER
jgi:phospholipid/cholesterol/gamma-HCH transport system substrate-binding protein